MAEELSIASILLMAATVAAFVLMIRHAHKVRRHADRKSEELHKRLHALEKHASSLRRELEHTRKSVDNKIDKEYLEKRMEGLVNLVRKR